MRIARPAHAIRTVAALVLALSTSGCWWSQVGFGPEHQRSNPREEQLTLASLPTLHQVWSTPLPGAVSEPMIREGRAYTRSFSATFDHTSIDVHAVDLATGTIDWTTNVADVPAQAPEQVFAPVAFTGDELWSGGLDGFARIARTDGSLIGETGFGLTQTPVVTGSGVRAHVAVDIAVFQSRLLVQDDDVVGPVWQATLPGTPTVSNGVTVVDGRVLVATGSSVYQLPVSGCGSATCTFGAPLDLGATINEPVVGVGDRMVISAGTDVIVASPAGDVLWRADVGAPGHVAVADGTVHVAAGTQLLAFDLDGCGAPTCAPSWTAEVGATVTTPPAVAGGVVYVGSTGLISALPAAGCGAPTCDDPFVAATVGTPRSLSVAEGRLVVASAAPTAVTAYAPG